MGDHGTGDRAGTRAARSRALARLGVGAARRKPASTRYGGAPAPHDDAFRPLFASNPIPMWVFDADSLRFLEVNAAAVGVYGYTRDEFLAMDLRAIRPTEDHDRLAETVAKARANWRRAGIWRHRTKGGEVILVEVMAHSLTFADRPAVLIAVQDVTEREQAVADLQAHRARLAQVLNVLPEGLMLVDRSGRLDLVNAAARELAGQPATDYLPDGSPTRVYRADGSPYRPGESPLGRALRSGETVRGEDMLLYHPDSGRFHPILAHAAPLRATDGDIDGAVFAFADVSPYKATETALRETRDRLEAVVRSAPLGVILVDRGGIVRLWNPAAERIFGWSEAETLGQPLPVRPDGAGDDGAWLAEEFDEDRVLEIAGRRRTRDGRVVEVLISTAPVYAADGSIVARLKIVADVTEHNALLAQFHQSQKLEAVGRLAGGVAHDFNNILGVVLGYAELSLDRPLDATVRAALEQMRDSAERGARLTRQLLAFSRKSVTSPAELDPAEVVRGLTPMLRRLLGEDVRLESSFAENAGLVLVDPGHLEQVLLNLAVNARDAMPRGGTLTIRLDRADDAGSGGLTAGAGGWVRLTVSDTGLGMDEATRGRVFEPFFTTKAVGHGTGLGLSTAYGVVQQSGGTISVASEPGRGATFTILLPRLESRAPGQQAPEPEAAECDPDGPPGRRPARSVLVVEDDAALRDLVAAVLRRAGYHVLPAGSTREALVALGEADRPVDLLLTDVVLPGESGRQLGEAVRALSPATTVLYMSGYTDDAVLRHGVSVGAEHMLRKPFTPRKLLEHVGALLADR